MMILSEGTRLRFAIMSCDKIGLSAEAIATAYGLAAADVSALIRREHARRFALLVHFVKKGSRP